MINFPLFEGRLVKLEYPLFDYTAHCFGERRDGVDTFGDYELVQVEVLLLLSKFRLIHNTKQSLTRLRKTSIHIYRGNLNFRPKSLRQFPRFHNPQLIIRIIRIKLLRSQVNYLLLRFQPLLLFEKSMMIFKKLHVNLEQIPPPNTLMHTPADNIKSAVVLFDKFLFFCF